MRPRPNSSCPHETVYDSGFFTPRPYAFALSLALVVGTASLPLMMGLEEKIESVRMNYCAPSRELLAPLYRK